MTAGRHAGDVDATVADLALHPTRPRRALAPPTIRDRVALEASERVGRYLPIEELGRGGMGRVLRAYDTKLQREVALKVLAAARIDGRARARMVREARTMARLNHPNVVAVYDVEDEPEHGIVLAMELVKGCTLSDWLTEKRPPWGEVLAAFVEAGRGLAAAHGAGLLHRDFKPANVLVALGEAGGPRGPLKVTDFGLAKDGRDDATAQSSDGEGSAGSEVTEAGVVMGTPAYMAPEQYRGEPLTDAADQYAFCVSLWEALYGERPFQGATREQLRANVLAGKRRPPPSGPVPSWLRQACERGLSLQPEDRWPSMSALLTALGQGRARARRRLGLAAAGVLVVVAAGGEAYRRAAEARRVAACEAAGDEIEAAWSSEREQALHDALLATGAGYAATTAEKVMPWLERQAAAWREARVETCLDGSVRRRWSAEVVERSQWCLDERWTELRSLVDELTRADAGVLHKAVPAAAGLASVAHCRDPSVLAQLGLPPAADRDAVREVRAEVTRAGNLERAGRYDQALVAARGALERAESLRWRPLSAAARVRLGRALVHEGDYAQAEAALEDAYFEATDRVAPEAAFEAASELVFLLGHKLARHPEARRWGRHAEVALEAVHDPEGLGEASLLRGLATVEQDTGDYEAAKALGERVVWIREQALGPDHPDVAMSLNNLAGAHWATGDYEGARTLSERALAIRERALGLDHPDVAMSLGNLANLHRAAGEHEQAKALLERAITIEERTLGPDHADLAGSLITLATVHFETGNHVQAKALYERALAIGEKTLAPDHPMVAMCLSNLANVYKAMGAHEHTRAMFERSVASLEKTLGPDHPTVAMSLTGLALAQEEAGDLEQAKASHARALAVAEKALDPGHPDVARMLHNFGRTLAVAGDLERARAMFERALAARERALGADHFEVADTLGGLATVALAQGRSSDAVELASRAVAIVEKSASAPTSVATLRFALARALWDAPIDGGRDRDRARSLAEQARDAFRDEPGAAKPLAKVEQWLVDRAEPQ